MYVVGLTGPTGSGKSVVAGMMEQLGACVLRADDASRELLAQDLRLAIRVREALGGRAFRDDGTLDRREAAAIIFQDPQARKRLEAVMHPEMVAWLRKRLSEINARANAPAIVVVEAAILTHMGARPLVHAVVRVTASRELCLHRIMERDGLTRDEALARLNVHEQLGLFEEPADFVIETTGTLDETRQRVEAVWKELVRRAYG